MQPQPGSFVISLDFEIMWGVRDVVTIEGYGNHLRGVHTAIPKMLQLFASYDIHATWATVGFLFFENKEQLLNNLPPLKPQYLNKSLSPYDDYLRSVGESAATDPYHFGNHLVKQIIETPGQELATHTFSHYYCLENGQTVSEFEADIKAAVEVAAKNGSVIKSIVFPRNQYNADYLDICMKYGITSIRGNEHSWLYEPRAHDQETGLRRAFRLMDAYINFTGHHGYAYRQIASSKPFNIASSRFLRQYKSSMDLFEWLRLRRIKKSMTHAAKNNLVYHLWWHPHNFGINQEKNMEMLTRILDHYRLLNRQYGFKSLSMAELSQQLDSIHES